ncbi:uncharacterized protein CDAR_83191 [Caerostris darwini]|uniref:Uncharacterized protein n=1 Tax=Caerostris darwini TaxID=1538125 RepID=A0AAV4PU71_9ARAC|nr:uncharacterized protein CDAR_83191 [Caerostris darwini]
MKFPGCCSLWHPGNASVAPLTLDVFICICRWLSDLRLEEGLHSNIEILGGAVIFRVAKGPFVEEFYQCVTYGFYTAPWQEQLYTSFSLLFMFLIPLCILIATYTTTFATIASE